MDRNDLFVRLGRYAPTAERTTSENFFTELVAYILGHDELAQKEFMKSLPKSPTGNSFSGKISVETQQTIESDAADIQGTRPDIWLRYAGGGELIVECKIDAPLRCEQLENYLRYAQGKGGSTRVIVVSKSRNAAAGTNESPYFLGEVLWSMVADRWNKLRKHPERANSVEQFLIDGALEFMEEHQMGPFEPFEQNEMGAPSLWRPFQAKVDKLLARLCDRLQRRQLEAELGLVCERTYPPQCEQQKHFKGLFWGGVNPQVRGDYDFCYFLGFMYGKLNWLFQPAGNDEPESVVFVGAWGADESMKSFLRSEREKLNKGLNSYLFEVLYSADGVHPFLVRRRPLGEFIPCVDQASAILKFFEESDQILAPRVPEIYQRFREPAGVQGQAGPGR
jgi:hypothetical protein